MTERPGYEVMPIMLRNVKATTLTLAVLFAAGCAKSDYVVSRNGQTQWERVDKAAMANAPQAVPPKILPETFFAAGRLFEAQGLLGKAITQYRKAVAVNHEYGDAFHRLGVVLGAIGKHAEATEALGRAAELRPNDAVLRNNLGFEFILQGRWEEAERELNRAIELQPHFARAHINLGMTLSRGHRFDEALASFRKVLPEPDAYYNLALMLRGRKRYEAAADALKHTLAIAPHFTAATTQLEQLAERLRPVTPSEPKADAATALEDASETTGRPAAGVEGQTAQVSAGRDTGPATVDDAEAAAGEKTTPLEASEPDIDVATILGQIERMMDDVQWATLLAEESPVATESTVAAKGDDLGGPLRGPYMVSGAADDAGDKPCEDAFFDDSKFTLFKDFFNPEDADTALKDAPYALPMPLTDGRVGPTAAEAHAVERTGETPDYEDPNLEDSVGILFRPNERWMMPADAAVSDGTTGSKREVLSASVLPTNETGPPWRIEEPGSVSTREARDLSAPPGVRVELPYSMHPLETGATKTPERPEVKGRAPSVATPPADRKMPAKGDGQKPVKKGRPSVKATVSSPTVVAQVEDSQAAKARRADVEDSRSARTSETQTPDVGPVFGPQGPVASAGRLNVYDPPEQMMFPTSEEAGHPGEVPGIHAGVTLVPHATDAPRPVMSSIITTGETREKGVVETSVPEAPVNGFKAFTSLELKLVLVRQEIDCWEDALSEQAAVSGSDPGAAEPEATDSIDRLDGAPEVAELLIISRASDETGHPTSRPPNDPAIVRGRDGAKPDVVGAHDLVPGADPASHLYLPAPPVEFDYDRLAMVGSPTPPLATLAAPGHPLLETGATVYGPEIDLFIEEVFEALNSPSGMPDMTTVLTLGRAKTGVPKRRRSSPVLIREVWEEPAYIADRTPSWDSVEGSTRTTLAAGVDVAQLVVEEVAADQWDETFGDVEELFSIVRNQMDCWQTLESSDAAQVEQFEASLRYTDSRN